MVPQKKAPYPTQTGELMVPSIANTYTIEILQYVSMTSAVQYSQYLHNRMNCVDLDFRSAAGTLSLAHCYAIYSICTGWLQLVFHFGTENRADQLKKTPCMYVC